MRDLFWLSAILTLAVWSHQTGLRAHEDQIRELRREVARLTEQARPAPHPISQGNDQRFNADFPVKTTCEYNAPSEDFIRTVAQPVNGAVLVYDSKLGVMRWSR